MRYLTHPKFSRESRKEGTRTDPHLTIELPFVSNVLLSHTPPFSPKMQGCGFFQDHGKRGVGGEKDDDGLK